MSFLFRELPGLARLVAAVHAVVRRRRPRPAVSQDEPMIEQQPCTDAELRQLREQAESARRVKAEFLANINHELRTPLNAVIGFSELLEQQVFGPLGHPRYVEYARLIRSSGDHLLRIVTEILDMSRSGAGLIDLYLEPVALDRIIANCERLLSSKAAEGGVRLIIEPSTAPVIVADSARIEHALLNLISNAIKFTTRGGHVTVAAHPHASGAEIVVADTGVGMSHAELLIALEPFRQVDSSLTRGYDGMGLGLPVAKRLIEMHGGMLLIDSMPGDGTSVSITLPRRPPQLANDDSAN
jgi:two-component system cell cycle sensor histidine kinase PleC